MLEVPRSLVPKPPVNKLPPEKIMLIDDSKKTKHTAALTTHVEEFVEAEGLVMPQQEVPSSKDPRDFESEEQWRDTARRQLRMQHLRVDIFTIWLEKMMVYGPTESSLTRWTDVLTALLQSDGGEVHLYSSPSRGRGRLRRLGPHGDIEGLGAEDGGIEQEMTRLSRRRTERSFWTAVPWLKKPQSRNPILDLNTKERFLNSTKGSTSWFLAGYESGRSSSSTK